MCHELLFLPQQKMYRKDFEEGIKGRPSMDLDKTPEFLHIKEVTSLLKEVEDFYLFISLYLLLSCK